MLKIMEQGVYMFGGKTDDGVSNKLFILDLSKIY